MIGFENLRPKVEMLLEKYPELRDDDGRLISGVYFTFYGIDETYGFIYVKKHRKELGLPSEESIARVRRKIQEENPALRPSKKRQKEKQLAFDEYYDFARG